MNYQQIRWIIAGGALVLVLVLTLWIPWQALLVLLFIGTIVFAPIVSQLLQIVKAKTTPIPQYHPPAQSTAQEPSSYEQGYQAQTLANSTSWSPFTSTNAEAQPHEDQPGHPLYEQLLVQYPEQTPQD